MPARVRSGDEPFADSKERHQREIEELRRHMALLAKIVFTVVAVLLAIGALLVVGQPAIRTDNVLVKAILNIDNFFDGPFSRDNGVFAFTGDNAVKLNAVCNWGLGAIVYMLVGNVLAAVLRPDTKRKP